MINKNNKMLFFILSLNLLFLGLSLSWIFDKDLKFSDIKFSQLSISIGPLLTSIALFIEIYVRRKKILDDRGKI